MTDQVQPGTDGSEGQGAIESEGSIFDPYLQSVPEGWDSPPQGNPREIVSQYLKDAEKNVNSKLQEAADLQKRFGDYKDIDLSVVPPQQLSEVLDFVQQVGQSPEAYQEWLKAEAEAAGLLQAPAQEEQVGADQDLESYIQQRIEQALNPVNQQLSKFEQSSQEQAQTQAQRDMETHIESTLAKLESEHNVKLTDEQQEAVLALGDTIQGNNWVEEGFAKYQALTGAAQASLVKDKAAQHAPALTSGGQAAPPQPKSFADVREAALQMAQNLM